MIFISVLNVVSHSSGASGINRYWYRAEGEPPRHADGVVDILRADDARGELVHLQLDIKGGGNQVPTFLDLAAVDHAEIEEARAFFESADEELQKRRPPLVFEREHFGIHFNTNIGLYPRSREDLKTLATVALSLLEHPPQRAIRDNEPFVILVAQDEKGLTFKLDRTSEERLRTHHGPDSWVTSPLHITHQTLDDFNRMMESIVRQFGLILTRLKDDEELLQMGGVRYVSAEPPHKVLAQWPARKAR